MMELATEISILIAINGLAFFWKPDDDPIYICTKICIRVIAGVISVYIGASWIDFILIIGMMVTGLGTLQLIVSVIEVYRISGPSRGWSQFREKWNAIKGKIRK